MKVNTPQDLRRCQQSGPVASWLLRSPSLPALGVCCLITQAAGLPLSSLIISFIEQSRDVGVIVILFLDEEVQTREID